MERYEKYKDSGFDWIGEIPEHWELKKLKYLTHIGNGKDHKKVWDNNGEYPIIGTGGKFGNANTFLYDKPSVILGRKGTIDKPQFIEVPFWAVDTAYYTIIKETTFPKYLFYLSKTINFDLYKYGSAVPSMNQEVLKEIYFAVPDKQEQTTIANYLDHKTAEIDELINQKEQLLKLYEEEKTAIINQAVTKGINVSNYDVNDGQENYDLKNQSPSKNHTKNHSSRQFKDSGIDWLGEIHEHWKVKKLKYVVDINKETLSDKTDDDYQIQYIDIGNVEYGILKENPKKLLFEKAPSRARRVVNSGDTLISTVRTYLKAILFIENANDNLIASTGFAVIAPSGDFLPDYLFYILSSEIILQSITASSVGVSYPAINASEIGAFYSWFPQKEEQTAIVQYIETETSRISTKSEKTKKLIDLLGEYKQSLISEVVTGKIKVSNYD